MKKLIAIALSLMIFALVFAGCSAGGDEGETTTAGGEAASVNENLIATDGAVVKESDAINFIKQSYSEEELGLDKVEDEYSLMVADSAVEIEGEKYIKVAANVMTQSDVTTDDGKPTYHFTAVGEYYISFDGEKVLMKNIESGEYSELENRYADYSAKGETTQAEQSKDSEQADDARAETTAE